MSKIASTLIAGLLVVSLAAPNIALADGKGKGRGKSHGRKHDNGKHRGWSHAPAWGARAQRDSRDDWRRDDRSWDSRNSDDWRRADSSRDWSLQRESDRRQQTKNQWRNLAYLGAAATLFGILRNDRTVTFAGAAGTLYSLHRYEQDRKSQSRVDRARAQMFSQGSFTRNGHRYQRRLVNRNGDGYYQFYRTR